MQLGQLVLHPTENELPVRGVFDHSESSLTPIAPPTAPPIVTESLPSLLALAGIVPSCEELGSIAVC